MEVALSCVPDEHGLQATGKKMMAKWNYMSKKHQKACITYLLDFYKEPKEPSDILTMRQKWLT